MKGTSYLFGYGSLVNKSSFERTLGHELPADMFRIEKLHGYVRSWTLCHSIAMYPEKKQALLPPHKKYIVYLDISPLADASIMGSLVEVSSEELERFDKREKNYHRVDVTKNFSFIPSGSNCFVYIGNDENKTDSVPLDQCMIIKEYVELIEKALSEFEPAVIDEYWKTTLSTTVDIVSVPGFYGT